MDNVERALRYIDQSLDKLDQREPVPFRDYLNLISTDPARYLRNVFQVFHDMVNTYVGRGVDEYPDDPESIGFMHYDCSELFVEKSDHPFFADRIFANRLMNLVESFRSGAQQNKIYIFDGPPGCGKSTFLDNLLRKFEEYANKEAGLRYETVWRLNRRLLGDFRQSAASPVLDKLYRFLSDGDEAGESVPGQYDSAPGFDPEVYRAEMAEVPANNEYIEVPCPSHDNPILMIPKAHRGPVIDSLIESDEFKWNLSSGKEYDWVFRDQPCTICATLFEALLDRLKSPRAVFQMLYARPSRINRRLGRGITVFNPGDGRNRQDILSNAILQRRINGLLRDSNQVKYIFSRYANTNNGVYALMDIKSHNVERIIELHNIIS
ncbi:MAG: serine protein kinase PrkA, partial [bacterium]